MPGFSNKPHTTLQSFDLCLSVNVVHVADDIGSTTPDDCDIHSFSFSVLVSALHPLTTHPERWERRFT